MFRRHTLLDISPEGRRRIHDEAVRDGFDARLCGEMLLAKANPLPGIVRRDETGSRSGMIPVGFSSWTRSASGRVRIPGFAWQKEIVAVRSPFRVLREVSARGRVALRKTPALLALFHLERRLAELPLELGVWGSAAMELATGRPYTQADSDLDILVEPRGEFGIMACGGLLDALAAAEEEFGLRIDAELRVDSGHGVSLKELMGKGTTVLGKGEREVALLDKNTVFDSLSNF